MRRKIGVVTAVVVVLVGILFVISAIQKANRQPPFFSQFDSLEEVENFLRYFLPPGETTIADVEAFNAVEAYGMNCGDIHTDQSSSYIVCDTKSSSADAVYQVAYHFQNGTLTNITAEWLFTGL